MKTHARTKTDAHRRENAQRGRSEADLEATINTLFLRCPTLCGFAVRDVHVFAQDDSTLQPENELCITEVSVYPMRDLSAPPELCDEIAAALDELIDADPNAGELLRERAFARTFH